jgi:hypothetical protein
VTPRQSRLRLRFPLGHCPVPSGLRERRGPSHTKQRDPLQTCGALNHCIASLEVVPGIRRKGYCYACADAEHICDMGRVKAKNTARKRPQSTTTATAPTSQCIQNFTDNCDHGQKSHPRGRTRTDQSGQRGLTLTSSRSSAVGGPGYHLRRLGKACPPQSFSRLLKTSEARRRDAIMSCEARRSDDPRGRGHVLAQHAGSLRHVGEIGRASGLLDDIHVAIVVIADSGGSRPRIRDDLAQHSDLISLSVPG